VRELWAGIAQYLTDEKHVSKTEGIMVPIAKAKVWSLWFNTVVEVIQLRMQKYSFADLPMAAEDHTGRLLNSFSIPASLLPVYPALVREHMESFVHLKEFKNNPKTNPARISGMQALSIATLIKLRYLPNPKIYRMNRSELTSLLQNDVKNPDNMELVLPSMRIRSSGTLTNIRY